MWGKLSVCDDSKNVRPKHILLQMRVLSISALVLSLPNRLVRYELPSIDLGSASGIVIKLKLMDVLLQKDCVKDLGFRLRMSKKGI